MKSSVLALIAITYCFTVQASDPWRLSSRGVGPIRAGMTIADAERLLGSKLVTGESREIDPSCDHVHPKDRKRRILFMVSGGQINRVVVSERGISTISGAMVGDSTSRLKSLFGSQLEISEHKYHPGDFYYFVWDKDRQHGVKFEILDGVVDQIYAGDTSIELVEGCS